MKWLTASFFVTLAVAHAIWEPGNPFIRPLSMFRDGPHGWIGHLIFAQLLAICAWSVATLARAEEVADAGVTFVVLFFLFIVAVTPSLGAFHILSSAIVMGLLYLKYAVFLWRTSGLFLGLHLLMTIVVGVLMDHHSYGLGQKCLISYLVITATVHHGLLEYPQQPSRKPAYQPIHSPRRRVIYTLDPGGPSWRRRTV